MIYAKPIPRGSHDVLEIAVGRRGTGKSTWALRRAYAICSQSYMLVHDPSYSFPARLPGERVDRVARHDRLDGAIAAIERTGGGIHSVPCEDAGLVLEAAIDVAERSLAKHGGFLGIPCTVVIDEAALWDEADARKAGGLLKRVIATSRHLHVGLILTIQHSKMMTGRLLALATRIAVFQTTDDSSIERLRECGFPAEWEARARALERYQYIEFFPGSGKVEFRDGKEADGREGSAQKD